MPDEVKDNPKAKQPDFHISYTIGKTAEETAKNRLAGVKKALSGETATATPIPQLPSEKTSSTLIWFVAANFAILLAVGAFVVYRRRNLST